MTNNKVKEPTIAGGSRLDVHCHVCQEIIKTVNVRTFREGSITKEEWSYHCDACGKDVAIRHEVVIIISWGQKK